MGVASVAFAFAAATHAGPPALPKTGVGKIAERFLSAVNSSEPGATDQFVVENISDVPWQQMTREKYSAMLRSLRKQSGDLRVERVFMADDRNLRVLISSAKAA